MSGDTDRLGDSEIHHHRFALIQHHILGLDVTMNDALAMSVVEGRSDGASVMHSLIDRKLMLSIESLSERLALDVRHHVVEEAVALA